MRGKPPSLDPGPREADLNPPRRHLGIFLLAHEVDLSGPYICMSSKLTSKLTYLMAFP